MILTASRSRATLADEALLRDATWKLTPVGREAQRWLDALAWEDASANTIAAYTILAVRLSHEFPVAPARRWLGERAR